MKTVVIEETPSHYDSFSGHKYTSVPNFMEIYPIVAKSKKCPAVGGARGRVRKSPKSVFWGS